jgi:hypothetical protein
MACGYRRRFWSLGSGEGRLRCHGFGRLSHRVGNFPRVDRFFAHHDVDGLSWDVEDGMDNGLVPDGKVFFSIPPGQTRWVNVDAYIELKANYSSVYSQAGAQAGFKVEVRYIVLRPAAPGRELR